MNQFHVRPLDERDHDWVERLLVQHWHSTTVVNRGRVHHADRSPGYVALLGGTAVGLLTYRLDGDECEIVTLNSLKEGVGIGTGLIEAVKSAAVSSNCRRIWVVTTNDNINALRFYQKRGFSLVALYRNAIEISRKLKPEIPSVGLEGIPIRDELELEIILT